MSKVSRINRNTLLAVIGTAVGLAILSTLIALTYMRANYVDVTHAPEYAGVVGKTYSLAIAMPACGITMDQNYKPPADHIAIIAPPGFGGPEVLWCTDLPAGTVFRIASIKRCTNCLGGDDKVMVDVTPARGFRGKPARLWGAGDVLLKDDGGRRRLNLQYYTPVDPAGAWSD